ncbi:putative 2-aminoethylphosphonate ABC transporter ATP-binding protein [Puniceibacterium sp. IMCC21224]|uniref:putative 2-aminoethylphosphonate ABC transporter ATP-binding protein n=1 Tax=Puniceibacterium sp. IMCC21224 TaxID=1618204 RepID=UPI00065D2C29|nr:putative 2-aminoethylphosphonate ABC transporter ATP-binding protein [Puniceibacterium sp. IMCC21224]KMK66705.1 putative 2-aminoethylphosphonate ABC transporter, ATP-binding protein [Puniceibacterium sp. IMCC21224]
MNAIVQGGIAPATDGDVIMDAAQPYLRIRNLWKAFGDFVALKDINLDVASGEFVCFLGPSGCGKTTLLRTIAGLDPQSRGAIHQGGTDISSLPTSKRDYGIVFQSYALFPNLTVRRNIAFGLENTGRPKPEIAARVSELLDLVGLPEQAEKYPANLSGGQQQRIALARAIAINPGLLLLDEPLSALDAKVRVHLRHEIKELQRKLGVTTIMVTHDQEEALSMADRIVVMNHGVIEQVGSPTDIYRHPASLFVADFIGETNKIETRLNDGHVQLGDVTLKTGAAGIRDGSDVTVAIRPEDILPHPAGEAGADNLLPVTITDMEFLGSFWRTHLRSNALAGVPLVANFSMNAMRRLALETGTDLSVELPAERVLAFVRGA